MAAGRTVAKPYPERDATVFFPTLVAISAEQALAFVNQASHAHTDLKINVIPKTPVSVFHKAPIAQPAEGL